ncbi:glutaminyl-peptide cyclotransferase [Natronosporangium hydrolyticum]|uniref:Glutaminyl-peptide cyclotransferase n=1 Tax=Natronosporangium hydrolyticum TaxID=2811111 RepID=A0A895YIV6_9ACTN|nr:glutaminyl-peptide cyclotransferase [Natronosporangium hydrolyticum]QSB14060.1 glutaminyl-peptide cyclotransferase [Natronosporangium hydrolyticum]
MRSRRPSITSTIGSAVLVPALLAGCTNEVGTADDAGDPEPVAQLTVTVLERYPTDPAAFTQGLELFDGQLYESTGQYGESDIRISDLETGEVVQLEPLPAEFFGEGLTIVDDSVWQLTWQEGVAFRWDRDTLVEQEQVSYDGEGWGLCHDPERDRLVMSDGSAELTFRDPETFEPTGSVEITRDGEPQPMINELECVGDQVWANIWLTDEIVRIDPARGVVEAVVDASGLLTEEEGVGADVLNGIAAIPDTDTFLITGKLWPWLFEVRFDPAG